MGRGLAQPTRGTCPHISRAEGTGPDCLRRVLPSQGLVCTRASQAHSPGTAVLPAGGVWASRGAVDLASGQMSPEKRGLFQDNSQQGQETGCRGTNGSREGGLGAVALG